LLQQSLASHILTIIYTLFVGIQLAFFSQKLGKVTLGNMASIPVSGIGESYRHLTLFEITDGIKSVDYAPQ
jgi:hypothetical protein